MAITESAVLSQTSGVDVSSLVTGSASLTANRLVLAAVWARSTAGTLNTPTLTTPGATWVLVASFVHGNGNYGIWVFRTMVSVDRKSTRLNSSHSQISY